MVHALGLYIFQQVENIFSPTSRNSIMCLLQLLMLVNRLIGLITKIPISFNVHVDNLLEQFKCSGYG